MAPERKIPGIEGSAAGSISSETWDAYINNILGTNSIEGKDGRDLKPLLSIAKRLGIESSYATYMGLEVYRQTWGVTQSLLECAGVTGGLGVNVGSGPAFHELVVMRDVNLSQEIIAIDKSPQMLYTLEERLGKNAPKLINSVKYLNQDASLPWPEEIQNVSLFLTNTAICWMTPEERANTIKNAAGRMSPGAKAVMQFRTKDWDEAVVKARIPDEIRANPFRAIAAAIGARQTFTLEVDRMSKEGILEVVRPTEEEVIELASYNGLNLVTRKATFWPGKNTRDLGNPDLGHGAAMLFVKR